MSIYISANPGFSEPMQETVLAIKNAGFEGVFFNLNERKLVIEDVEYTRHIGLQVESIHLPYNTDVIQINDLWTDNAKAPRSFNELIECVDFAHKCGVSLVVLHSSNGYNPPPITKDGIKYFEKLAEYCNHLGITLSIENGKRTDYVYELMQSLNKYDVGLCFDVGHANAYSENLDSDRWRNMLAKLVCVHLHDNDGRSDLHLFPGMGNVDFNRIIGIIKRFNPNVNYTFEPYYAGREKFYGDMNQQVFFTEAFKSIQRILGEQNIER